MFRAAANVPIEALSEGGAVVARRKKHTVKLRTEEEKRALMASWREARTKNVSVTKFCARHKVNEATLRGWFKQDKEFFYGEGNTIATQREAHQGASIGPKESLRHLPKPVVSGVVPCHSAAVVNIYTGGTFNSYMVAADEPKK